MPATRSRTSTEQTAEVASEEVKHQPTEETEPVVAQPAEDVKEAEPAPVVETPVEASAAEPKAEEAAPAPENGSAVKLTESTENGKDEVESAEAVTESDEVVGEKRKSVVDVAGGEGDGPDSTEVVAKKAKVDEEAESAEPAVEASA